MLNVYRSTVTTVTALGSYAGHDGGDYCVQSDRCARIKQQQTPEGRKALLIHGATYAATQFVTKAAFYTIAGLRVPLVAQAAGTLTEAAVHVVIDDGRLLSKFAKVTGKCGFHQLGTPRQLVGVVDASDGNTETVQRVHLVSADAHGNPTPERDEHGHLVSAGGHDNPNPSAGRALLDQAMHKWIQIPLGVAVTTTVACWITRRNS